MSNDPMKASNHSNSLRSAVSAAMVCGSILGAATVHAQVVGHTTERSPYRDVRNGHLITLFGGPLNAAGDPLNVLPTGGPAFGLTYEFPIGGPALIIMRYTHFAAKRTLLDPTKPAAERVVGERNIPIEMLDVGFTINLTGQKSYRNLVPYVHFGAGIITDRGVTNDPDPFKLGTGFELPFGLGLRYVMGDRWHLRGEWGNVMHTVRYPNAYYVQTSDGTSIAPASQAKNNWYRDAMFTLGISRIIF
jgi:hypothetical protein